MFPPSANTHTAQEISTFPGYHDDINNDNNTTKPEDNTFAQTHDEDEDEEKKLPLNLQTAAPQTPQPHTPPVQTHQRSLRDIPLCVRWRVV
jgi:hypothetical protein